VRVASLGDRLFLHSAYPTEQADSVFFGPDSYRYASFLAAEIPRLDSPRRLVDIGAGSGVGAIMAAALSPATRVTATDINPLALRFARISARHSGVELETVETSGLDAVEGPIDLVIANPPFVADPAKRLYRDGGGMHGARLSLDGRSPPPAGSSPEARSCSTPEAPSSPAATPCGRRSTDQLPALGLPLRYAEIDPDIFGELLEQPGYEEVERLAAVGAVIRKA
jgi:SAM-dependent methyltransferase